MAEAPLIRVLHVVGGGMDRGGIETWLMNVLRTIDRSRFSMDFLVKTTKPCAYDDEARALGARIISCPYPERPWHSSREFRRVLRECGPYDVVHSHVGLGSGYNLRLARQAGVPVRIAHTHGLSALRAATTPARRTHQHLMRMLMKRHATCGLACSEEAGAALYGSSWSSDRRWQIHYCAIALAPFREQCDRQLVREELGLDEDCLVVGHVGSFAEAKNHAFLVRIAQELADRMPSMRLLLVGDGPLRPEIERQVQEAGLLGRVLFLGCRDDVARLLMGAMDVFVFPSVSEGLGLAFVEAQAAGLIALCADTVPREADVVDALCHRLSLAEAPAQWAEEITRLYREGASISRKQALSAVEASPFNIERSVAVLSALYSGEDAAALAAERG